MKNIVLDAKDFKNKEAFHDIMKDKFNLPSYYARNINSLSDLLFENDELDILIMNADKILENLGDYGKSVLNLFDNLNEEDKFNVNYIYAGCFRDDLNYTKKNNLSNKDKFTLKNLGDEKIKLSDSTYIAEGARLVGNIETGENVNIWYNATIRADYNLVKIGKNSNVQDNAVIHLSHDSKVEIGENVTIGHTAIVHGAKINDNVIVGMGAIILDDVVIGENTIIGAGSLVTKGKVIPAGSLVLGSPAKVVRELTAEEIDSIIKNADDYVKNAQKHNIK